MGHWMLGPERRLSELDVETFQRNGFNSSTFSYGQFAINGFGRIGRNVLRAMSQKQVERVVAIKRSHGPHTRWHICSNGIRCTASSTARSVTRREHHCAAGHKIRIMKDRDPANLPWKKLDIDVVLEATGFLHQPRQSRTAFKSRRQARC